MTTLDNKGKSMLKYLGLFVLILSSFILTNYSHALSWETSCTVDKGSIQRKGWSSYVFKTSKNHCRGGIFKQRSEINTSNISVTRKQTYVFSTIMAMNTKSAEPFLFFQIHDGRNGCSPPLSVRWGRNNRLSFDSDYTKGIGMAGCVQNVSLRRSGYTGPPLKRDGTKYPIKVVLAFDGNGSFNVDVSVKGNKAISGKYAPSSNPELVRSKQFYMKHGVYSQNVFAYEMTSEGVRVGR
ncbi:hypothetical protein [Rhizobium giardinii]|uniref:hypothetical protein n=1 Tax=Rhizobium giardinii TaxID=56731 RepID=UPI003D6FDC43